MDENKILKYIQTKNHSLLIFDTYHTKLSHTFKKHFMQGYHELLYTI